jgi:hypothetical protein
MATSGLTPPTGVAASPAAGGEQARLAPRDGRDAAMSSITRLADA